MNTFEAGVISGIPIGGIMGGILCKSYGLLAISGGVIAGGIAGGLSGWGYAYFLLAITSTFIVIWRGIRKLPKFDFTDPENEKIIQSMMRISNRGAFAGIVLGGNAAIAVNWYFGLLVAFTVALLTGLATCVRVRR
jgi:hypothetical protein